jgi:dipeptidyl aminopeptidase/acylaminoacyl peptidase
MGRRLATALVALSGLLILPAQAAATFPGQPGLLATNAHDHTTINDHEISIYPENKGFRTQLTNNAVDDLWPAWSADGNQIAFIQRIPPESTTAPEQLWVMNADGSGQHQVGPAGIIGSFPSNLAWSPDGSKIAYTHWNTKVIHTITPTAPGTRRSLRASTRTGRRTARRSRFTATSRFGR